MLSAFFVTGADRERPNSAIVRKLTHTDCHRCSRAALLTIAVCAFAVPGVASTLSYWRMEGDGTSTPVAGTTHVLGTSARTITNGGPGIVITDVSGNGNTVWAWDEAGSGQTYQSSVPAAKVPLTGATNSLSIQNSGIYPACFTWSKYSHPSLDLETNTPLAWTIEASIRPTDLTGNRTFVGRDGNGVSTSTVTVKNELGVISNPGASSSFAPLYFQHRGGRLWIQFTDVDGRTYELADSSSLLVSGNWYNVAATSDGSTLKLYRDSGAGYQLVGAMSLLAGNTRLVYDTAGSTTAGDTQWSWTLGRGRYGTSDLQADNHTDRWFGNIDEVRISDAALKPSQLLFAPTNVYVVSGPAPTNQTVAEGVGATLKIIPGGQNPLLQWRLNGAAIPNATNETYSITSADVSDAGNYDVVITNNFGSSITSSVATLVVSAPVLAHRYSFTNDLSDTIGGATWAGTLPNGGSLTNGQLLLSGSASNYMSLPGGILGNYTAVTIEAWATFPSGLGGSCWFFGFGNTNGTVGTNYLFCEAAAGKIALTGTSAADEQTAYGLMNFQYRTNYHIVAVYNPPAGYIAIYLNGKLAGANTSVTWPMSSVNDVFSYIGHSLYSADPYFDMNLDELRIHKGALSPQRIAMDTIAGPNTYATNGQGTLSNWTLKVRPHMSAGYSQNADVLVNYAGLTNFNLTANSPLPVSGLVITSSDSTIINVTGGSTLNAMAPGTALITAVYQGVTNSTSVTVLNSTFGVKLVGGDWVVDTGAGLVFNVQLAYGNIDSIVWNGGQMQNWAKTSAVNSGLANPATAVVSDSGDTVLIAAFDAWLTHYYLARRGEHTIYMATYNNAFYGELRWITRLYDSYFTNRPPWSDLSPTSFAVESTDVYGTTNGLTYSKFFGNQRAMDLTIRGETGPGVGLFMDYGNRESDSGGPFFRDIQDQTSELYNYMWSGHSQTEGIRAGVLNGPYAIKFTDGTIPPGLPQTNAWSDYDPVKPFVQPEAPSPTTDYSWIESEGLAPLISGWVGPSGRGIVNGIAYGISNSFQQVVGFANTNAQYWAIVGTNGLYTSPLMKPGTYLATLYKGELEVATNTVTVVAGQTNTLNLASAETVPTSIFRIGEWDGTPKGFLNADKITLMHPSDVRMGDWLSATNFVVGTDPISAFPMAQFRDLSTNGLLYVKFVLTANQIQTLRLRYGITVSYSGGRPAPNVNGLWGATPYNPRYLDNRSLTHGSWRGFNDLYSYDVPASAFVVGTNTLTLGVISGQSGLGGFLSPSCAYDAIELSIPNSVQARPAAPSNLSNTVVNASQVALAWRNNATNEMNFLIERSIDGTNYTLIAAVSAGVTNYTDSNVVNAANALYRVRAFNSSGYSAYADQVASTTPQAYLKFDESTGATAADSTGNGWNGTLVNSPTWVSGYSNNAISLESASSQYVTLPAGVVTNLYDFTMSAWVKQTTISSWARLFDFGTGTAAYMFLAPQNGSNNRLRFAITTSGGGGEQQIDGTSALPVGVWKHVAVTLSGTSGILYVDGVPVGTNSNMTLSPALLGVTTQNYIGKSQYADPYLNGLVDEFRIYNGALTPGEVATFLTPLTAPANLTTTGGDTQAAVKWNAVANATRYQVFRSVTNGGPYTLVGTVTTTNFTDSGLLNGTNYFYVVKASNTVGQSSASTQVSARPVSFVAPQCSAVASGINLTLSWPADNTGWRLQVQTNALTSGLGTNWFDVPNSTNANQMTVPITGVNSSVFFRLVYP